MKDQEINEHVSLHVKELYAQYVECPNCFLNWKYIAPDFTVARQKECEYCEENPNMTSKQRLIRMIDVLPYASVNRFSYTLQLLIKHVEIKD